MNKGTILRRLGILWMLFCVIFPIGLGVYEISDGVLNLDVMFLGLMPIILTISVFTTIYLYTMLKEMIKEW